MMIYKNLHDNLELTLVMEHNIKPTVAKKKLPYFGAITVYNVHIL